MLNAIWKRRKIKLCPECEVIKIYSRAHHCGWDVGHLFEFLWRKDTTKYREYAVFWRKLTVPFQNQTAINKSLWYKAIVELCTSDIIFVSLPTLCRKSKEAFVLIQSLFYCTKTAGESSIPIWMSFIMEINISKLMWKENFCFTACVKALRSCHKWLMIKQNMALECCVKPIGITFITLCCSHWSDSLVFIHWNGKDLRMQAFKSFADNGDFVEKQEHAMLHTIYVHVLL